MTDLNHHVAAQMSMCNSTCGFQFQGTFLELSTQNHSITIFLSVLHAQEGVLIGLMSPNFDVHPQQDCAKFPSKLLLEGSDILLGHSETVLYNELSELYERQSVDAHF